MKFKVNITDVDCACAAGVFAVNTDDEQCSYDAYDQGVTPQCGSIDIMEANIFGFNVQSNSCEFDFCDPSASCMNKLNEWEYGPSSEYTINSKEFFTVKTQFFATPGADGQPDALALIRTTLSQNGVDVVLEQDCPDYLAALSWNLSKNMSIAISTYNLSTENSVSSETCYSTCSGGNMVIADLEFVSGDSILEQDLIIGQTTSSLDDCMPGCAECRTAWYEYDSSFTFAHCVDYGIYRFGDKCEEPQDCSGCNMGSGNLCHKSWPNGDVDQWNSPHAKCRTLPDIYVNNQFEWAEEPCRDSEAGLCGHGCGSNETCTKSWIVGDPWGRASAEAMCRCKPSA